MKPIHPKAAAATLKYFFAIHKSRSELDLTKEALSYSSEKGEEYWLQEIANSFSPLAAIAVIEFVFSGASNLTEAGFQKKLTEQIEKLNWLSNSLSNIEFKESLQKANRAKDILNSLTFDSFTKTINLGVMKYYDNDPDKGGKEISAWEHMERNGTLERLKAKGIIINPTHNCEMLQEYRKENFEKALQVFRHERGLKKLDTTESDVRAYRLMWLNKELQIAEKWIQDSQSNSDRLELVKYLQSIEEERNELINERTTPEKSKQKLAVKHYVLTYLFECHAKRESYPIGLKKEVERIGQQRMKGKSGNSFYKTFGILSEKDILDLKTLFEIGGDNWREIVLSLTSDREKVEAFLVSKGL
jgi:hypothetical protein